MADEISFLAAFPPIQSAIKITGDGGGMRIQLDIPENQMGEAVKLLLLRQCVLRVTIEAYEQENPTDGNGKRSRTLKRTSAKQRI